MGTHTQFTMKTQTTLTIFEYGNVSILGCDVVYLQVDPNFLEEHNASIFTAAELVAFANISEEHTVSIFLVANDRHSM
jgi:hypothetical protein